ncbi:MAG: hypothetical protein H7836_16615, partial [Magnetococcus sp. YQC-3]
MYRSRARTAARRLVGRGGYQPLSRRIRGRGSFWTEARKFIMPAVGGTLGGFAGGPAGALGGIGTGAAMNKLLGFGKYRAISGRGAYTPYAPSYTYPQYTKSPFSGKGEELTIRGNIAKMRSSGENSFNIKHEECLGNIYSSTSFDLSTIEVNPGLISCCPWLASVARSFSSYRMNGLIFTYRPICSDSVSTATVASLGSVSLASDTNVMADAPTSTIGLLGSQFSVSGKPSGEL